jgi:predicted oxidoreductase
VIETIAQIITIDSYMLDAWFTRKPSSDWQAVGSTCIDRYNEIIHSVRAHPVARTPDAF